MVHDDGIINQSKPVILNNEEKLDRISHTLVFYVNGKEVCLLYLLYLLYIYYIYYIILLLIYCYTYYLLYNIFKFMHACRKNVL